VLERQMRMTPRRRLPIRNGQNDFECLTEQMGNP
jgi:hypothetical protein